MGGTLYIKLLLLAKCSKVLVKVLRIGRTKKVSRVIALLRRKNSRTEVVEVPAELISLYDEIDGGHDSNASVRNG